MNKGIPMKFQLTWSHLGCDFVVAVSGWYTPGTPDRTSGPSDSWVQGDGDEWEYDQLVALDGLPHDELVDNNDFDEAVLDMAWEHYAESCVDWKAEAASDRAFWRDYDTGRYEK